VVASPPHSHVRAWALNLALLAVTVVLFAGFLELMLRLVFARSLDFSMEMWKYAVALKQPVADPRLSFAHRPNTSAFLMGVPFAINSAGLRDREFPREKPAGVYRIVWLGDSTTVGWGVPIEGTAPKLLERELNAAGTGRFEVLNAGVGNYDTVQEVEHYLTIDRAFHPDLVILEYFINDAEPVPRERTLGMLGHSYLAAFAISRFDGALRLAGLRPQWREYYASLYRDGSPGLEAAKDALGRLTAATAHEGTGLVVAILPELHQINGAYPFEREQAKIKNYLAARHVETIDLLDCLRGHGPESGLWITPADSHPNAKANGLIAGCMATAVRVRPSPR
jgi:lysophospholipase L1-like esterase